MVLKCVNFNKKMNNQPKGRKKQQDWVSGLIGKENINFESTYVFLALTLWGTEHFFPQSFPDNSNMQLGLRISVLKQ